MTAQCRIDRCPGPIHARGLCERCYRRERGKRLGACLVPGCGNPQHTRGLCNSCYQSVRKDKPRYL